MGEGIALTVRLTVAPLRSGLSGRSGRLLAPGSLSLGVGLFSLPGFGGRRKNLHSLLK